MGPTPKTKDLHDTVIYNLAYRSQVISVVVREINMPKFGIVGEN
jgi:hypothetical protein